MLHVSDDDEFAVDLSEMPAQESAAFFAHLLKHATAGQENQVIGHLQDVVPTPHNVLLIIMGLAKCLAGLSRVVGDGQGPTAVELRFAQAESEDDLPDQQLVLDGDGDERAKLEELAVDAENVPRALRIGAQIMSAGMADDSETAFALAMPLVREYADQLDEAESADDVDMDNCAALQVCTVLAQSMVQYAYVATDMAVRRETDRLMEEIEAG